MKKYLFALALAAALGSGWALAQPAGMPAPFEGPGLKDWAWAATALVLVLAALVMLLKALKRVGRFKGGRGAMFEMRGSLLLDNRKYLAAVAVDGRLMIIGVTPDRLIPLGQWPLQEGKDSFPADEPDFIFKPPGDDSPPDISIVGPEDPRR